MTSLFAKKSHTQERKAVFPDTSISTHSSTSLPTRITEMKPHLIEENPIDNEEFEQMHSFHELSLCEWICSSTSSMGFKRPTSIQCACIPAILTGRDVLGCAETGSGKTAAFALPILQHLSQDPYGIFALVLTPTRELALQISEQFLALGTPISIKVCLIIGGLNMTQQSIALSKKPHIVIATPGRLRAHLMCPDPPNLSKVKYIVLDEADRLLAAGFESELQIILSNLPNNRQTLLFSATLTSSLIELETMAMKNTLRFDLTKSTKIPSQLIQQYLFMPSQVKVSYLVAILYIFLNIPFPKSSLKKNKDLIKNNNNNKKDEEIINIKINQSSIIIFINSCKRCQEISETLTQLNISNVCLHSLMSQTNRLSSLSKFRNSITNILICTDVASRGLDISNIELVINFDLPHITSDYIHRVGRTARAGKKGSSISFVTPFDVEIIQNIEDYTNSKMSLYADVSEEHVVKVLNVVAKASRVAELKLLESGFDDKVEVVQKRKRKQLRSVLRKVRANTEEGKSES